MKKGFYVTGNDLLGNDTLLGLGCSLCYHDGSKTIVFDSDTNSRPKYFIGDSKDIAVKAIQGLEKTLKSISDSANMLSKAIIILKHGKGIDINVEWGRISVRSDAESNFGFDDPKTIKPLIDEVQEHLDRLSQYSRTLEEWKDILEKQFYL